MPTRHSITIIKYAGNTMLVGRSSTLKKHPNLTLNIFTCLKSLPPINAVALSFIMSVILVFFYNHALWKNIFILPYDYSLANLGFVISLFAFFIALTNIVITVFSVRHIRRPAFSLLFITAASTSYFMNNYGIMIDKFMIQNTFETDTSEAFELMSFKLVAYIIGLGILPSIIIYHLKFKEHNLLRGSLYRASSVVVSLVVITIIAGLFYQDYASLLRNNRHLRHLVNPINVISATTSHVTKQLKLDDIQAQPIALDAEKKTLINANGKPNLTILVVGETARAANFSLNGYQRETNPQLKNQSIVNFDNVSSCGTATATSLPCMFSKFPKDDYSHKKSKQFQGLLDVLSQVGISVLWRDNNSGCKGACDRIPSEQLSKEEHPKLCNSKECYDEILLDNLGSFTEQITKDTFIVLHQKGSHGPAYYQRYPQEFAKFHPICETNQLQNCSQQEITNAYDNTILYTDHFLNEVIEFLSQHNEQLNTAMLYISDHGESLGENGIYLHGTPYFMAPPTQTHVPFIAWFSDTYQQSNQLNMKCLMKKQQDKMSQDNLFHSVLGLSNISTQEYDANLDIFNTCRHI